MWWEQPAATGSAVDALAPRVSDTMYGVSTVLGWWQMIGVHFLFILAYLAVVVGLGKCCKRHASKIHQRSVPEDMWVLSKWHFCALQGVACMASNGSWAGHLTMCTMHNLGKLQLSGTAMLARHCCMKQLS
jgi:hypothetical protein